MHAMHIFRYWVRVSRHTHCSVRSKAKKSSPYVHTAKLAITG